MASAESRALPICEAVNSDTQQAQALQRELVPVHGMDSQILGAFALGKAELSGGKKLPGGPRLGWALLFPRDIGRVSPGQ